MITPAFLSVDLRFLRGRVLAVGDIHGRFDLLRRQLEEMRYDRTRDRLILLGDLVDRGPFSEEASEWWDELRVQGNHELMTSQAALGLYRKNHRRNGGAWLDHLDIERQHLFSTRLMNAPIAIEALTPGGHRVGFVHAQVPTFPRHNWHRLMDMLRDPEDPQHEQAIAHAMSQVYDWGAMRQALKHEEHPDHRNAGEQALWARSHVLLLKMGYEVSDVVGIDHVFHGHTIVEEPLRHGNCSWIDTGAYRTDVLTIVDVDEWMDRPSVEK